MLRIALITVTAFAGLAVATTPAVAQRGAANQNCEQTQGRQTRRSIFGGIATGVIGGVIGSSSAGRAVSAMVPVASLLSDAIMTMLDCGEQRQAAQATEQITTQAERGTATVGTTVQWQSESRPGVTGTSTVTQVDAAPSASGQRCMIVQDAVIIDGEETRVPKRMCNTPPSGRWVRV